MVLPCPCAVSVMRRVGVSRAAELPKGFLPCVGWVDAEFGSPSGATGRIQGKMEATGTAGDQGDKRSAWGGAALFHLFFLKPDGCEVSARRSLGDILVGLMGLGVPVHTALLLVLGAVVAVFLPQFPWAERADRAVCPRGRGCTGLPPCTYSLRCSSSISAKWQIP